MIQSSVDGGWRIGYDGIVEGRNEKNKRRQSSIIHPTVHSINRKERTNR